MRRVILLAGVLFLSVVLGAAQAAEPKAPQGVTGSWMTYANADRVSVLRAQGDTVWAGSMGGGLVGWDVTNDTFVQLLYPQDRLASNTIRAIAIGPEGTLWAATTGGVTRYPPGGLGQDLTLKNTSRRAEQRTVVQERAVTGERQIQLRDIANRSEAQSTFAPGYLMFGTDPTIYFYRDWDEGEQEIVISPRLLRSVEPGTPVYAVDVGLAADDVRDVLIDHAGRVWLSTVNGVSVYDAGNWTVHTTVSNPWLVSNDAGVMAVDRADRVWISHQERGQFTMFDGAWHTYTIDGAIQALTVNPADGNVWAATNRLCDPTGTCRGGGAWAFDGGAWHQRYRAADGIADDDVNSLAFGADGRLWLGHTLSNRTVVSRRNGSGWTIYETVREAIEADFNSVVTTQTPSDLWTAAAGRVWTRHLGAVHGYAPDAGWEALYTGSRALNSNHTRAIATDEAGRIWVGAERMFDGEAHVGGGINVWDGNQWTHYTAENSPLLDDFIAAITVGRGKVWVETLTGFSHFADGAWTSYTDLETMVEEDYWSIVGVGDMQTVNDNLLWTVDDAERVWVWGGSGAKYYRPDTGWVEYSFLGTLEKQEPAATYLQANAGSRETFIRVSATDIPGSATAQSIFSNGYLMIGDDATLYRYESFEPDPRGDVSRLQISPALTTGYDAGTPIFTVELGLLSDLVSDVTVDPDGRVWFATRPRRVGSTNVYGGLSVLDVEADAWTQYTVRNTSRRGQVVGHVRDDAAAQDTRVPADFGSAGAADEALSSGFVMFEGDPTLYRYTGYSASEGALAVHPIFTTLKYLVDVGLQQALPAGTAIHAVELGLLGTPQSGDGWADRLTVDHLGRMWVAVRGVGISVHSDLGEWINFRRADDGLASVRVAGMLPHDNVMWIPTDGGGVSIFRSGSWQTYNVFNSGLVGDQVQALTITQDGAVWIATQDGGISVLTLPGFRLDAGSAVVLAVPGETVDVSLEVVPVGGFSDNVALSVQELPPGVDATLVPDNVDTEGSVELIINVSEPVAPGSYPLTLVGRSPGGLMATRQLTLRVVSFLERAYLPVVGR
ncbi:MAG: hypothetical protein MAG451_01058 [Anaerolineales bacterium]|nr:hypothetical protein [Anaerolineales bacterium]